MKKLLTFIFVLLFCVSIGHVQNSKNIPKIGNASREFFEHDFAGVHPDFERHTNTIIQKSNERLTGFNTGIGHSYYENQADENDFIENIEVKRGQEFNKNSSIDIHQERSYNKAPAAEQEKVASPPPAMKERNEIFAGIEDHYNNLFTLFNGSFAIIYQTGSDNYTNIKESHLGNTVSNNSVNIYQWGLFNLAIVRQGAGYSEFANPNLANIYQYGANNLVDFLFQGRGAGNSALILQVGIYNKVANLAPVKTSETSIEQIGSNNIMAIVQVGEENMVKALHQEGFLNEGGVYQWGRQNTASMVQQGNESFAHSRQYGSNNVASITQMGRLHHAKISQEGSWNRAVIKQKSGNRGYAFWHL